MVDNCPLHCTAGKWAMQQLRGQNFAIFWHPLSPAWTVFIPWAWTKTDIFWPPPLILSLVRFSCVSYKNRLRVYLYSSCTLLSLGKVECPIWNKVGNFEGISPWAVLHWMTGLNQNLIRGTCVRILNRFVYYGRRVLRKLPADSGLSNYRVVTSEFS